MRTVLFYRDYQSFTGGHLKVWNYFEHLLSSPDYDPWVRFSSRTTWDETNPWRRRPDRVLGPGDRLDPDVLFLGGLNWLHLTPQERTRADRPVVNLIAGLRHADPDDPRYPFLAHAAIRLCVSQEVADAICATRRVRGPVFTMPTAVDLDSRVSAISATARDVDVLIVATKGPEMGRRLRKRLKRRGREVRLIDRYVPRPTFPLAWLQRARASVFLPLPREGFYLPALEGMALGTVVVCPDCIGNRSFCVPGENCFRPQFSEDAIVEDVEAALALPPSAVDTMLLNAKATADRHDLAAERRAFLAIMRELDRLWAAT